jgi:hypothetical protein
LCGKCFDFIQKNKLLAEQVMFLARSLGFAAYITACEKGCQTGSRGTYYRICISGNTDEIPTRVKRKQATIRTQEKDPLHVGFFIEKVADCEDYFGFTLDKDNLYLDDSFNMLHNSGKTTMALNLLENASNNDVSTVFYSLDMHRNQVFLKLAIRCTEYNKDQIKKFIKEDPDGIGKKIKQAVKERYKNVAFFFNATLTMEELRDRIFDLNKRNKTEVGLVVVDYAGRIAGPYSDSYANAKYNALRSKEMADITNSAWFMLSQIARKNGEGSIPLRSSRVSKDSGDWEECAANVITMWRPFMNLGDDTKDNVARLFLAKNRMGPQLEGLVHWNGAKGSVSNMTDFEIEEYRETRGEEEDNLYKNKYR